MFRKKVQDDLVDLNPVQAPSQAQASPDGQKKKPNFVVIVIGVVVLAVVAMIAVKALSGGKKDSSYGDLVESVYGSDLGLFNYTITVETGQKGTLLAADTLPDVPELDSTEEGATDTPDHEFSDWNRFSAEQVTSWQYPCFEVNVNGVTTSVEPYTSHFTISIGTPTYQGVFTEVTAFEGKYYVDIDTMRNWLINSKDSYLVDIGENVPQGTKYLVIPEDSLVLESRYAENSEVKDSGIKGLKNIKARTLMVVNGVLNNVIFSADSSCFTSEDDVAMVTIAGDEGANAVNRWKKVVDSAGDFIGSLANSNKTLYTEEQYAQTLKERDNILAAFEKTSEYLNTHNASDAKFSFSGLARDYQTANGSKSIEASFSMGYTTDDKDVIIRFSGNRSGGSAQVTMPTGSQITYSDFVNGDGEEIFWGILFDVADYFNFTGISTEKQLEITPDNITRNARLEFIDLVNEAGCNSYWLNEHNLDEYLETWMGTNPDDYDDQLDTMNSLMVGDFIDSLNNVTGGLVVEKVIEKEEEIAQFPDLDFTEQGIDFSFKYNTELSTPRMIVLDMECINKNAQAMQVDLGMFSLRTLLGSVYPANNETMLLSEDAAFDVSSLPLTVELPASSWGTAKLYFVISDDSGHMDLFLGNVQKGAVVEY